MRIRLTTLILGILASPAFGQPAVSLDARWSDLASADEAKATRALLALSATPKEVVVYFKTHLKPVQADATRVAQLLKQFESGNFVVRTRAMQELEYLGKYIKSDLEAALKANPSAETKQRIQQLIEKMPTDKKPAPPMPPQLRGRSVGVRNVNGQITIIIDGQVLDLAKMQTPPPEPPGPPKTWVRAVRAITLLEHIGTPEARQIIELIASGETGAMPTTAAREALARLKQAK